jgi:hypothetical protein
MAFRNRRKTSLFPGFESETISTKGGPGGVNSDDSLARMQPNRKAL